MQKLEIAAPKVDFYDRVADVGNLMTASVVGKKIGMSAQVLNNNLDSFKVYDKRQKGRVFSQWFIGQGLGEIKKTDNGFNSSKLTNKGEQWSVEKFVREGIIAADTSVLPMHSRVYIIAGEYSGYYEVKDTGGAIVGNRIDIYFPTKAQAYKFGRRNVTVQLIKE